MSASDQAVNPGAQCAKPPRTIPFPTRQMTFGKGNKTETNP